MNLKASTTSPHSARAMLETASRGVGGDEESRRGLPLCVSPGFPSDLEAEVFLNWSWTLSTVSLT